LRRLGAIALAGGMQVLPARDECVEAFQWLAQEIRQAKGEALVMRVERFEGLTDQQLIELFRQVRKVEYEEIETQAAELEKAVSSKQSRDDPSALKDQLEKLRRHHSDIARVDYFECPEGLRVAARLARIEQSLSPKQSAPPPVPAAVIEEYRDKQWVTRPRPHVDRLACAWLIRRFINPKAVIRYAARPEPDEIAFDSDREDAQFGHQGNLCTFETMIRAFKLKEPGLFAIAEIVHEIDLRDGHYLRPETVGIDAILNGWVMAGLSDAELEAHGVALFEGLYAALSSHSSVAYEKRRR
jgi:hypothetical protein